MYDYDYYYEQKPSEIDILIDETVDKIRKVIELKAKEDIEQETLKSEKIQKEYDEYTKSSKEAYNKLCAEFGKYKKKYEQLEAEYNKKRQEIPSTKYCVGDKVYVAQTNCVNAICCPKCEGKGYINVTLDEYGDISITCPNCKNYNSFYEWADMKNVREARYYEYSPEKLEIKGIEISIDRDDKITTTYYLGENHIELSEDKVFATAEECKKYCEKKARQEKEEAYKVCGRELID